MISQAIGRSTDNLEWIVASENWNPTGRKFSSNEEGILRQAILAARLQFRDAYDKWNQSLQGPADELIAMGRQFEVVSANSAPETVGPDGSLKKHAELHPPPPMAPDDSHVIVGKGPNTFSVIISSGDYPNVARLKRAVNEASLNIAITIDSIVSSFTSHDPSELKK